MTLSSLYNLSPAITTPVLLILSNVFMTFAWYGHLRFKSSPLVVAILVSWSIAFFEYCFQVPANRLGHGYFNVVQLKTMQEVITLIVFSIFSIYYLNEPIKMNHLIGFLLLCLAVFFIFKK
ncbi:MAG: DMT family protein [Gammaproteobacteria bacterium]